MLATTIVIMGLGTFLIGLLPTYEQIGVTAPVLLVLLRLIQGVGLGGEWGGAVLMVVENAQTKNRGLLGSMVQFGYPIGTLAAIGIFALLSHMPEADFLAWAWRISVPDQHPPRWGRAVHPSTTGGNARVLRVAS